MNSSVISRYEGGSATRKIKEHGCISELRSGETEDIIMQDYRFEITTVCMLSLAHPPCQCMD